MALDAKNAGGVKSLRAMFETNEGSGATDDRGRSSSVERNGTGERPLSKVRASFVGVDPSGQLGRTLSWGENQQRDRSRAVSERSQSIAEEPSTNTSPSDRRTSHEGPTAKAPPIETVLSKVRNLSAGLKSVDASKSNTASPIEGPDASARPTINTERRWLAAALPRASSEDISSPLSPRATSGALGRNPTKPAQPNTPVTKRTQALQNLEDKNRDTPTRSIALAAKMTPSKPLTSPVERHSRPTSAKDLTKNAHPGSNASRGSSTNKTVLPVGRQSSSRMSDVPARTPFPSSKDTNLTGISAHGQGSQALHSRTKSKPRDSTASVSSTTSNTTTTTAGGARSVGGFVKPRPKSPTKPINLPAHLVAPTASSAAKHDSGSAGHGLGRRTSTKNLASNPSRTSATGKAATDAKTKRALTPQQKKPPVQIRPDGDFLNRMMRPTASSSSKVASQDEAPKPKSAAPNTNFLDRMMRPTTSSSSKTRPKEDSAPVAPTASSLRSVSGEAQTKSFAAVKAETGSKLAGGPEGQGSAAREATTASDCTGAVKHSALESSTQSAADVARKLNGRADIDHRADNETAKTADPNVEQEPRVTDRVEEVAAADEATSEQVLHKEEPPEPVEEADHSQTASAQMLTDQERQDKTPPEDSEPSELIEGTENAVSVDESTREKQSSNVTAEQGAAEVSTQDEKETDEEKDV